MRRIAVTAVAMLALGAAPAAAKQSKDFTFKPSGPIVMGEHQDFPVTIAPDERNGAFSVGIRWTNPGSDWDLYVFQRFPGGLEQVGASTDSVPDNSEQTIIQGAGGNPVDPGQYIIRVVNFAALDPSFDGVGKFSPYVAPNKRPTARLKLTPKRASSRKRVKIDASRSKDSDGTIVSYAFDLDGDGAMETAAGKRRSIKRRFKPGIHHVGVRVTDNKGARSYATATVAVYKAKKKRRR